MHEEACAFMCAIFCLVSAILSGYTMLEGDRNGMILTLVFSAIVVLIAGYVLAMRHCR